MSETRQPAGPLSTLFAGSEAAKIMDFLLFKKEQHQTMSEIHTGTLASMDTINKIIGNLIDIDAVGIGARKVQDLGRNDKIKDEILTI